MKRVGRVLVTLLVLLGGVAVGFVIIRSKPRPPRSTAAALPPLVDVATVSAFTGPVQIVGHGTVVARREAHLRTEVGGRVAWIAPSFTRGARFDAGDILIRLDPQEYMLNVSSQRAQVDRAELDLLTERTEQDVARRAWEQLGNTEDRGSDLATREPHVRARAAELEAARSSFRRAALDVLRTRVLAPWNGVIVEKAAELGEYLPPGADVARLVATEQFEVEVSLPPGAFPLVRAGAACRVLAEDGAEGVARRDARVETLLADRATIGGAARALIVIDHPLAAEEGAPPILLGTFVSVTIDGLPMPRVVAVPRDALHGDSKVFVVGADSRVEERSVAIAWRGEDDVLVRDGVIAGDRVITTRVAGLATGATVRSRDARPREQP